jgi:DNA polymerase IV (DinB-like DNA polymerase)
MTRKILHIDMDAFYASIEEKRHEWSGPLVVCVYSGRTENSGAVSTCNYGARELGIKAGIPITRAKKIAEESGEDVKFVGMEKEYYRSISDRIKEEVLEEYSDTIEQASIDEFYVELDTESFEDAENTARQIQSEVKEQFDLTCSIGIGPNKLVAKIASDREKPEGLTVVLPEDVEEFMTSLELKDIHGIGQNTIDDLEDMGITTVDELRNAEPAALVEHFGEVFGLKLIEKANGEDDSAVEEQMQKQITRIVTLKQDSRSPKIIAERFDEITDDIMERVEKHDVRFGQVALIVVDTDIQMHTRSTSLKSRVDSREIVLEKGRELLESFIEDFDGEVRRVGLRVGDLEKNKGQTSFTDF